MANYGLDGRLADKTSWFGGLCKQPDRHGGLCVSWNRTDRCRSTKEQGERRCCQPVRIKEHIIALAPTRSGKGVGLVIPTLLSWEESAVVLDIKGENWALTSGWRHQTGYKVLRWDPTDALAGRSARYNPLEEIRIGTVYETGDVMN